MAERSFQPSLYVWVLILLNYIGNCVRTTNYWKRNAVHAVLVLISNSGETRWVFETLWFCEYDGVVNFCPLKSTMLFRAPLVGPLSESRRIIIITTPKSGVFKVAALPFRRRSWKSVRTLCWTAVGHGHGDLLRCIWSPSGQFSLKVVPLPLKIACFAHFGIMVFLLFVFQTKRNLP